MLEKKVSVAVCVYNGEEYLDSCIQSILSQTYKNIEIIVVDDGSFDNTKDVLSKYSEVKYIYQENKGIASARNTALRHYTGDYIAWLDADDLYLPNKIQEQVDYLEKYQDMDCVYNDVYLIDSKGEVLKEIRSDYGQLESQDFLAYVMFRQVIPCTPSMMYRRKCFEQLLYTPIKYAEDYWMTLQLAQKFKFGYLNKIIYKYRRHNNNLTNSRDKQEQMEIQIVKSLGLDKIRNIVQHSSLSQEDRYLLFSKILIKIGEHQEASKILEKIHNEDKKFLKYFYLGNTYYLMGNYRLAKKCYQEAIEIEPYRAEAYNNLGVVLFHLMDIKGAVNSFKKALHLKKEYLDPQVNLQNSSIGGEMKITVRELRTNLMIY